MDVLVAYDIADTESTGATRLRRVAQICEKYGQRVQHSVFECRLSPTRIARMEGELQNALDNRRDSVLIYQFADEIPIHPGLLRKLLSVREVVTIVLRPRGCRRGFGPGLR